MWCAVLVRFPFMEVRLNPWADTHVVYHNCVILGPLPLCCQAAHSSVWHLNSVWLSLALFNDAAPSHVRYGVNSSIHGVLHTSYRQKRRRLTSVVSSHHCVGLPLCWKVFVENTYHSSSAALGQQNAEVIKQPLFRGRLATPELLMMLNCHFRFSSGNLIYLGNR